MTVAAPWLAPHAPEEQFRDYLYAPPRRVRVVDHLGGWHRPFVYRGRLVDRVSRTFEEDVGEKLSLQWGVGGRLVGLAQPAAHPLLLLGSDGLGRDILSRLLLGARTTLGVAALAAFGALALGVILGGVSGYVGGTVDGGLMWLADVVLVLPTSYVVLALRSVMPFVLEPLWRRRADASTRSPRSPWVLVTLVFSVVTSCRPRRGFSPCR